MVQRGSQNRETLQASGLTLIELRLDGDAILWDGDKYELWHLNDDHAGYTVEIFGKGFEFCRSMPDYVLPQVTPVIEQRTLLIGLNEAKDIDTGQMSWARDFQGRQWWRNHDLTGWHRSNSEEPGDYADDDVPPGELDLSNEQVRLIHTGVTHVNAYHVTREYGGPEEGGWYYDAGRLLASIPCSSDDAVEQAKALLKEELAGYDDERPLHSVLSGGKLRIAVEDEPGESYPARRPMYC